MSARPDFKGDYMGFSFGYKNDGKTPMHSSDLGIVRTSDGSRFNKNLLPTMQDKTVPVPGGDGTYYFGSFYTQKIFNISFAFDSLTEEQIATLKRHFGDKEIYDLIFDEEPYKVYSAKVTGTATLKYIPFAEGETNRIYKGEGTIQFTCYQPYAKSKYKWLNKYVEKAETWQEGLYEFDTLKNRFVKTEDDSLVEGKNYYKKIFNTNEWAAASKMKEIQEDFDVYGADSIKLYNAGDLESHFQLKLKFDGGKIAAGKIALNNYPERQLQWEEISMQGEDSYVKINTRLNLIEGYNETDRKTGNVYNKYIIAGDFFRIPLGEQEMITANENANSYESNPIEYNYYYF